MANGLDGSQVIVEGEVEIVEYLNDEYVSKVSVTSSAIVEPDTPISRIEDRPVSSTREALQRLAALSEIQPRSSLDATKQNQDQAYQT